MSCPFLGNRLGWCEMGHPSHLRYALADRTTTQEDKGGVKEKRLRIVRVTNESESRIFMYVQGGNKLHQYCATSDYVRRIHRNLIVEASNRVPRPNCIVTVSNKMAANFKLTNCFIIYGCGLNLVI